VRTSTHVANQSTEPTAQNWFEAVSLVFIWTAFIVLARFAVKETFTPYDLMFLRISFAGIAALGILLFRIKRGQQPFGGVSFPRMLFLGSFAGLGMTCIAFTAFSFAPASHGAVLMPGTLPFSASLLAWFILGERIGGRKLLGLGFILIGILFMAYQAFAGVHGESTWKGDLLFPFASGSWAVYMVFSRKWGIKPVDAIVIVPIVATVIFAPVYWAFLPKNLPMVPWGEILFHGAFQGLFAFMLSMWVFMRVMQAFGPVRTTMLTASAPVFAALAAIPLLGESLTLYVVAGLVAVSVGTIIGVTAPKVASAAALMAK
jgi:drug/metabolite transporter (DMT)-like permease